VQWVHGVRNWQTLSVSGRTFVFGNAELSLELWIVIAGISGFDD